MRLAMIAPVLLLVGCHSTRDDPGAVSPEEDRMLNEAASSQEAPPPATANDQGNAAAGNAQ